MKVLLLMIFLFLSPAVHAKDVDVSLYNRNFNITLRPSFIHLKAHDIDLSLVRSNCNSRVFQQTRDYFEEILNLIKDHRVDELNQESFIVVDDVKSFIGPASRLADYLRNLPNKLIESKLKEKIVCTKQKG